MTHLHVTTNGTVIGVDGGQVSISQNDGIIKKIPKESLESISIFSKSSITTDCIRYLLQEGIPVCYFSTGGKYFGRLESTGHCNIFRQKKQLEMFEKSDWCIELSKIIIKAKINNQMVVLGRYLRDNKGTIPHYNGMKIYRNKIDQCMTREEIMGFEGLSAKTYFQALGEIIESDFKFNGRSKRPPKDPFNAMLSLGYTLLMYELYSKIQTVGLHPYAGFLHRDHINHPTLASDLLEEWRPVIVDSMVLSLVQGHEIKIDDFVTDYENGGVFISKGGMQVFLKKYENKLNTKMKYLEYIEKPVSFRDAIALQVERLTKSIETGDITYKAISLR